MTHPNSLQAFDELAGELSEREQAIMDVFRRFVKQCPLTDREIMNQLGFHDMNSVRPRITELIHGGYLRECGSTKCPTTGKAVRLVEVCERQMEFLE